MKNYLIEVYRDYNKFDNEIFIKERLNGVTTREMEYFKKGINVCYPNKTIIITEI